ncbi:MAG: AI-2E family transporter [Terriglobales bacterium]
MEVDDTTEIQPPAESPASARPPRNRQSDHVSAAAQSVVAIAVVLVICYVAKLVVITLLVSILLAFMLEPLVSALLRVRVPRSVGAFLAVAVFLGVLYAGTYVSYNRASAFMQELPSYSERIQKAVRSFRKSTETLKKTTETMLATGADETNTLRVRENFNWGELLTRSAASVWEFVLIVSFVPFLVYFMLSWHDHVRAATVMLFRLENRNAAYLTLGRISSMIRSFVVGNLLIGLFMAAVSMIVFALLGLPYPYFLGFISGFLSLVPYLGLFLALVPPLVAGLGQLGGAKFLAIAATVFALHVFAINVLYPKLLGKRLQLNPLVITIALLLWGWIWGGMGLLLAIPLAGAVKIVFDNVESLRPYGAWMGD